MDYVWTRIPRWLPKAGITLEARKPLAALVSPRDPHRLDTPVGLPQNLCDRVLEPNGSPTDTLPSPTSPARDAAHD